MLKETDCDVREVLPLTTRKRVFGFPLAFVSFRAFLWQQPSIPLQRSTFLVGYSAVPDPLQEQKNIEQGISNAEGNGLRCQGSSPVDDEKKSVRVSTGFRVFSRLFVATAQYPPSTFDIPCWIFCGSRPAADSASQAAQEGQSV